MKKIYAFGFTYDDFAEGGFSPNFISFSEKECFERLKEEENNHAVVRYDFEKDFDWEDAETIAIVRDGRFIILKDLEEIKEQAFQWAKGLISVMKIVDEPTGKQCAFMEDKFEEMGLPDFASFQVLERLFT